MPGRHGFESASSVGEKFGMESEELSDNLNKLGDTAKIDK